MGSNSQSLTIEMFNALKTGLLTFALERMVVTLFTTKFNNKEKFYFFPTECIYVFCMLLKTNSDYFPIHTYLLHGAESLSS